MKMALNLNPLQVIAVQSFSGRNEWEAPQFESSKIQQE